MSLFSKLFGGSKKEAAKSAVAEATHEGFHIATTPIEEGGQFRVCAVITREVEGEVKAHKLIRADMCSSQQEASDMAMRKARQMIDEQGVRIFG